MPSPALTASRPVTSRDLATARVIEAFHAERLEQLVGQLPSVSLSLALTPSYYNALRARAQIAELQKEIDRNLRDFADSLMSEHDGWSAQEIEYAADRARAAQK